MSVSDEEVRSEVADKLNQWWMESGVPDGQGIVSWAIHALDRAAGIEEAAKRVVSLARRYETFAIEEEIDALDTALSRG